MGQRLELQTKLENILESSNVYFQPPANIMLEYPCIIYKRDYTKTIFADNNPYHHRKRYQITIIDKNPDSEIPDKIANFPLCIFDRFFVANNLNHFVYNLFF